MPRRPALDLLLALTILMIAAQAWAGPASPPPRPPARPPPPLIKRSPPLPARLQPPRKRFPRPQLQPPPPPPRPPPPRPPPAPPLPAMPLWARKEPLSDSWERNASFAYNRDLAAKANASGTVYDIVFMGDSLTSLTVWIYNNSVVWDSYWGPNSGLNAARMGVGGTTVEELTWRLMANGERLARGPRVMVLLVGINNLLPTNPWEKLDFLLNKYLAAAMPGTKVLVVAPLPSFLGTSPTLTQQYRPVVARCSRCTFSTCGSNFDWMSTAIFADRLHLTPAGYKAFYDCLKPVVLSLLSTTRST